MLNKVSKSIFLSTVYNYIGSISTCALSFITLAYLTKNLSIAEFGNYSLIISTQTFFFLLLSFGLPSTILRFVPEYIAKNDYVSVKRIIRFSFWMVLIFGVAVSFIAAFLAWVYPSLINKFFIAGYLFIASVIGILRIEVKIGEAVFSAFMRQGYKISLEVAGAFIRLILFVCAVKNNLGLPGIIVSIGAVDIFLNVAYLLKINAYTKVTFQTIPDLNIKRLFVFGIKEYVTKFLSFFWDSRIDVYVVTFFLGNSSTGLFYFVINMVTMLAEYSPGFIMQPISQAVFTRQYVKNENPKEITYLFGLNNKLKAFFIFPAFLVFCILIDKIILFFFAKYNPAVPLFPIAIFFILFYVFIVPIRSILAIIEKNEITLISSIAIIYKIPATIILTKNFGLMGTLFAVGSSYMLIFFIQLFLLKRHIEIAYPWFSFLKVAENSFITGFFVFLFRPFIKDAFSLFLVVLFSIALYFLAAFMNKAFNEYDRQIINKPFKKPLWVF